MDQNRKPHARIQLFLLGMRVVLYILILSLSAGQIAETYISIELGEKIEWMEWEDHESDEKEKEKEELDFEALFRIPVSHTYANAIVPLEAMHSGSQWCDPISGVFTPPPEA